MNATETSNVAQTILEQLGGRKFLVMTGAKNLMGGNNSLQFRLPSNFATDGINSVVITLDPSDTYTVRFGKIRGVSYKIIHELQDVYCDMLRDIFESYTSLRTSL